MIDENISTAGIRELEEKVDPLPFRSPSHVGLKSGLRGGKLASKRLSYGTAYFGFSSGAFLVDGPNYQIQVPQQLFIVLHSICY